MGNIITRTDAEALIPVESSKEIIQAVQHESAVLQLMKKLPNMSSKQTKNADYVGSARCRICKR